MSFEFTEQTRNEGVGVRGLSVVDELVAWASGSGGSVARTVDGGETWRWAVLPRCESLDFRSIKAFSDACAVVLSAGSPATIAKTVDGGSSWKETYSDATGRLFFDAVAFWDGSSGMALSDALDDGACLMETGDSGETWSRVLVPDLPEMRKGESHFAASGSCLAAFGSDGLCFVSGGAAARAFVSRDRGRTWSVSDLPIMSGKPSRGAFSVAVLDDGKACVVGGDYAEPGLAAGTAAYTLDGGRSWRRADESPPGGYNSCVAYVPGMGGERLLACGTQGTHVSEDGGRTWSSLRAESFHVLAFERTGRRGWAAGTDGRIAKIRVR